MAAKKKTKAGYDFIVAELKKNPDVSYGEIRDKANKKKLTVFPVVYGRAKAALGLVKVSPYGSKKKAAAKKAAGARRGPGRPRKSEVLTARRGPGRPKKSDDLSGLENLVQRFRAQEQDMARMRRTLEKVRELIDSAL